MTSLTQWTTAIKSIQINVGNVIQNVPDFCIFSEDIKNLLNLNVLNKIFENVEEIRCEFVGDVDDEYLECLVGDIKEINLLKESKLKLIELYFVNIFYSTEMWEGCQTKIRNNGWEMNEEGEDDYKSIVICR